MTAVNSVDRFINAVRGALDDGVLEGKVAVRFAQYSLRGRFGRGPLIMSADDVGKMRASLRETPELRSLLKTLVEGD